MARSDGGDGRPCQDHALNGGTGLLYPTPGVVGLSGRSLGGGWVQHAKAGPGPAPAGGQIDDAMDKASEALVQTRYFEAESLCLRALDRAHKARDFERMARIVLPLQEARRQKRLLAADSGRAAIIDSPRALRAVPVAGCYLIQPPLVGIDARGLRERADAKRAPVLVVTREPMTLAGLWPVVAATLGLSIRIRIPPPFPLQRVETGWTRDNLSEPPPANWFLETVDALSREGLKKVDPTEAAVWRVDDLMVLLEAHPDDELLHQALGETCREALGQPLPEGPRPRRLRDDPYCF